MATCIAHFIDTQNKGGAEVTLIDLAIYQKSAGFDVSVFHHNNAFLDDQCQQHGIKTVAIPAHKFYKHTYTLPLYSLIFAYKLRKSRIDVLHSHLFGPITGNAFATKLSGIRHIGTLHDIYMIQDKPVRIKLLSMSHWLGTRLVCVSNDMASFYKRYLSLNSEKITTIYNAAQINEQPTAEKRQDLFKRYSISNSKIIITTVGRLVPLKRIDWIINALSAIDKILLDDVNLLIIGDGPEKNNLLELAEKKLPGKVLFTGEISDVSDILNISDIYVQFSNTEGLSRSIIEALSCKLPCIVSDVGGNRELVIHNKNGFVIPASDRTQFTEKLNKLIHDESYRKKYGQASYEHYKLNFDFDKFQKKYLKIYNS